MNSTATASLWETESARWTANEIARLRGVYCGPAAVAWIAAVWNANQGTSYDYLRRLQDKALFPDGPRSFNNAIPFFKSSLNQILRRETNGQLELSSNRQFRYQDIHNRIAANGMPFIVRIALPSLRDGLHYATIFRTTLTDDKCTCYCQDNGVITGGKKITEGITITAHSMRRAPFFAWGARQVKVV
ncbi:hypothetical protein WBG78_26865 [Chryseolinea sp. T2]|uniref:hypothetical protein n=1 Tax=Chryseolinea sp. T2 TaxID=3129255 RepID=UPI0030772841